MSASLTVTIPEHLPEIVGPHDEFLKVIEGAFSSQIVLRGNQVTITGPDAEATQIAEVLSELMALVNAGQSLSADSVSRAVTMVKAADGKPSRVLGDTILISRGRPIRAKTTNQRRYVDAIERNTITFGIGPAGTGKTYLAVAMAVKALKAKEVSRIVLTRPAVEAGERLGFLPGDIAAKVDPYLKPLYDGLYDMLEPEAFAKLQEQGVIEVAPLAYMRGRTLNDSFVIVDEAQNTTPEQMKMLLTRVGLRSRAVITGDVTQVDLPGARSGLITVQKILRNIEGIEFVHLKPTDVVRHRIVQQIVEAYERWGNKKQ